jgi:ankyrin repeat protein
MALKRLHIQSASEGESELHQQEQIGKKQKTFNMPQHLNEDGTLKYSVAQLSNIRPSSFTTSCLKAYGINANEDVLCKKYFLETTEEHLEAYEFDVIQAIRDDDIAYLRAMTKEGRKLQGCNRFGESLVHLACRRSSSELVKFLITEGSVCLRVRDDVGRTPLHDVCWRKEPDFELIDLILNEEPDLLQIADKRGHLPLDYARREHWGLWISYLAVRMKKEIGRRLSL